MQRIKVLKDFSYFHGGSVRVDYVKGEAVQSDDPEMVSVALTQGWAEREEKSKDRGRAPENKDAAPIKDETK